MEPIKNSRNKERIRLNAEQDCNTKIRSAMQARDKKQSSANSEYRNLCARLNNNFWAILGFYNYDFQEGESLVLELLAFGGAAALGTLIGFLLHISTGTMALVVPLAMEAIRIMGSISNVQRRKSAEAARDRICAQANREHDDLIAQYRREAEAETKRQIAAYEKAVKDNIKRLSEKQAALEPMVQGCLQQFVQYINQTAASFGNTEQYVQLKYELHVHRQELQICGLTNGTYSKNALPPAKLEFLTWRYRFLNTDMECEALATVLTRRIREELLRTYQQQHGQFKASHNDADVTIEFRMPNQNYKSNTVLF